MARKLGKYQKKLIAKAFDPSKSKSTAESRKKRLALSECPVSYGYLKNGKCIKHKKAEKPEAPSLRKSIARVGGVRKKKPKTSK